jgi:outer membrane protein assembly factor BamB
VIAGDLVIIALQPVGVMAIRAADSQEVWRVELAADRPVLTDDELVYVTAGAFVHALRRTTGEQAWRIEPGQITADPVVRSGWLVVATVGRLSAFRVADGTAVWQRDMHAVEVAPIVDGDLVVVPLLDGGLVGLHLQTGEERWERSLDGMPGELLAAGGKVYVGANDKRFYAIHVDNGEIVWHRHVGAGPRARPAADDDHVYFVALDNVLRAFDRGNGALRWWNGLGYRPARSGPVFLGSALVVPGNVAKLQVFGRDGRTLTETVLPSTLVGLSNVTSDQLNHPVVAIVTGDLQHPWTLQVLETSTDPPPLPIVPLTTLPGAALAIALPG